VYIIPIGAAANLIFSYFKTDKDIFLNLGSFSFGYLLLAAILGLIPWITNSFRNMIWTRFLGWRFSFRELLKIVIGMDLGAAVSPTSIGGGFVKVAMFIDKGLSPGAGASLMTIAIFEDFVFFLISLPVALLITSSFQIPILHQLTAGIPGFFSLLASVGLILLSIALVYFLLRKTGLGSKMLGIPILGRLYKKTENFREEFLAVYKNIIKHGKYRFLLSVFLTGIQWVCRFSVITALLASFHVKVDPVLFFFLQWVVFTMMSFIPTPGAALGAEAAFVLAYHQLIPGEIIGLATAGWRILTFYFQLALGAVLFINLHSRESWLQKGKGPFLDEDLGWIRS
jgi:uncharacterized protein (TIRG00374 family)